MTSYLRAVCMLASVAAGVSGTVFVHELAQPAYPLYAIGSATDNARPPPPSDEDLKVIATNFNYIQVRISDAVSQCSLSLSL